MTINLGNGSVNINGRKYAINWTGQYAQHVAENFIIGKQTHSILHIEIQQALRQSKKIIKDGTNSFAAYSDVSDGVILVYFIKSTKFANITTGFKMKSTADKVSKNKRIGNTKQVFYIYKEDIETVYSDGAIVQTRKEAEQWLIRIYTKIYKSYGYKNFEIEFI